MLNKFVYIDSGRDNTFSSGIDNVTDYVESLNGSYGHMSAWEVIASPSNLTLTLNNKTGRFSQIDTNAPFYNKLRHGTLVKVTTWHNFTETTLGVWKIEHVRPVVSVELGQEWQIQITCSDPMRRLFEQSVDVTLQEDVRGDEMLTSVMQSAPFVYPYESAYVFIGEDSIGGSKNIYDFEAENITNFEESYLTVPFGGDPVDRDRQTTVNQVFGDVCLAERTPLCFWDVRNEQMAFLNRYHSKIATRSPYTARSPSKTFKNTGYLGARRYSQKVVNAMEVNYYPRKIGSPLSVIATKRNAPFLWRAGEEKTIKLRYYDPDNDNAQVGAKDVQTPVNGLDIIANSAEDGTGTDWTQFMILQSFKKSAGYAEVTYLNRKVGDPAYITTMQLRGTPIIAYQQESETVINTDSRYLYDKQDRRDNVRLISDKDTATEYGAFWTNVLSDDTHYFESITIPISSKYSTDEMNDIINLTPGDVITVEDEYYIETEYMITGLSFSDTGQRTDVSTITYILRPIENYTPFIIDDSSIGSNDLIIT